MTRFAEIIKNWRGSTLSASPNMALMSVPTTKLAWTLLTGQQGGLLIG